MDITAQNLTSRISGLALALEDALLHIAKTNPDTGERDILALRDNAVYKLKNSDIAPEIEGRYLDAVRPAIEAIETVFTSVLRQIAK